MGDQKKSRFWGRKSDGEALRSIINKLSSERRVRDLHMKHYHVHSAVQEEDDRSRVSG